MAYTYDAGISTPGHAGLIEVSGTSPLIRLNSSLLTGTEPAGGTFKLTDNPFVSTPPVRASVSVLPSDDGGILGAVFLGPWTFTIPGWLWVPSGPDDTPAAVEQLKAAFSAKKGLLTLVTNMRGWATRRQIQAQTNGPITFAARHSVLRTPTRDFQIPMVAPDPVLYDADTLKTATVTTGASPVTLTSSGTANVPYSVTITGPITDPVLQRNRDGGKLSFVGTTIAAGASITVNTNPVTGITAVDNTGANVYFKVVDFRAPLVESGTHTWTLSGTGTTGATQAVMSWRDGWA